MLKINAQAPGMAVRLRILIRFTIHHGMRAVGSHTSRLLHVPGKERTTACLSELLTNHSFACHNNARHTGRRWCI